MAKRGFILTTFQDWDAANQSENVREHGPDMDLVARDLTSQEVNDLFLQARSDDSVGLESEQDDNGYSEMAIHAIDEFLARENRRELEARLARRLEEKVAGEMVLVYAGLSPKAHALHITTLNDQLDGIPADLARQRAELRRKAAELAPHNLTEVIGSDSPSRGRS
ncbi:hypothetical protein IPH19_03180 [Candidatus Uhrbacteria bacterium]|nr:MAG: hypothetical protein IPH19_03180 [Candidatus Uhrbacteria bacterium]